MHRPREHHHLVDAVASPITDWILMTTRKRLKALVLLTAPSTKSVRNGSRKSERSPVRIKD